MLTSAKNTPLGPVAMKVFVSYCHADREWVLSRLVPCLEAGGTEVLIDRQFAPGKALVGQMDALQDQADRHLLVLSPAYFASPYCQHEMDRAIAIDPGFTHGKVIPVVRVACLLPAVFQGMGAPLCIGLCDPEGRGPWAQVLTACGADVGVSALDWLAARDELARLVAENQSVNLVVRDEKARWRPLVDLLLADRTLGLREVDLNMGTTKTRLELLTAMLGGHWAPASAGQGELGRFQTEMESRAQVTRLALTHFDMVRFRLEPKGDYDVNLFSTLRFLIAERKKLVLLIQSREPFASLLPPEYHVALSALELKTIELGGRQ